MANKKTIAKTVAKEAASVGTAVAKEFASIGAGVITGLLKIAIPTPSSDKKVAAIIFAAFGTLVVAHRIVSRAE